MFGAAILDSGLAIVGGPAVGLLAIATLLGVVVVGILSGRRPQDFPPGPVPLPVLGNIKTVRRDGIPMWVLLEEAAKTYGNIFSLKLGTDWYVVLNGYENIRDGLTHDPVDLSDRPPYYSANIFSENYRDIGYTPYSPSWLLHRQLAVNVFSQVYTDKNRLADAVNQQFTQYVRPYLDSQASGPDVDAIKLGQTMAMGSIVTWCFGPGNEKLHLDLVKLVSVDISVNLVGRRMPADMLSILQYLPLQSNRVVINLVAEFMSILTSEFERRRKELQAETGDSDEVTDVCGALVRAQRALAEDKNYEFLTDVHVVQVIASAFRGSIGLLTSTYWVLAVLAEYPDVQSKVAKEISDVIGSQRHPTLEDRAAMPYTRATVMEILRFGSVAPMGVPRCAHQDTKISGYMIPKGTIILYNIYATHFNEDNFSKPEEFNPGRFLDTDGNLISPQTEKLIPFGLGIRKCPGYAHAEGILFLNLCRLLGEYRLAKTDQTVTRKSGETTGDQEAAAAASSGSGARSLLEQDPVYEGSRWPKPFRLNVCKLTIP